MASVRIESEVEGERGWTYALRVAVRAGGEKAHAMTLSWSDYEHWSHGLVAPQRVAQAVAEVIVEAGGPENLPERFDASTARRWVKGFDELVRDKL